jgi:hypothetical protein
VVGLELESGSGAGAGTGMTSGSHLSVAAGAGERRWVGGNALGRLGQAVMLGCDGERWSGLRRGRARPKRKRGASGLWLARLEEKLG